MTTSPPSSPRDIADTAAGRGGGAYHQMSVVVGSLAKFLSLTADVIVELFFHLGLKRSEHGLVCPGIRYIKGFRLKCLGPGSLTRRDVYTAAAAYGN